MVLYHFSFGLESFFNFPSHFCGQVFFIVFFTAGSLNPVVALNSALRFTPLEIMPRCSLRAMRPSLRGRSPSLRAGSWGGAWAGGKKVETAF